MQTSFSLSVFGDIEEKKDETGKNDACFARKPCILLSKSLFGS